jgi:hypothetical protein
VLSVAAVPDVSAKSETMWWAREDSNLQPSGYEPLALTIELRAPFDGTAKGAGLISQDEFPSECIFRYARRPWQANETEKTYPSGRGFMARLPRNAINPPFRLVLL